MSRQNNHSINFLQKIKTYLEGLANSFKNPDMSQMVALAALIGVIGGVGAVIFYNLIGFMKNIFFAPSTTDTFIDVVRDLPWYHRIGAPALGGLIIGPLIYFFVPEAKGHGVPEVMEAVALKGGKIRARVAPFKAIISAICIGSGGSAGREGPIVQIGSSFGSFIGQTLELSSEKVETLLGAGAAAGIAGTFNAPLAGVMFSIEVLLKDIKLGSFSPIVVASVVGTAIANFFLGDRGAIFDIPEHTLVSLWEFFPYLFLGVVAAVVAIIFENSLYSFEHFFEKFPLPDYIKPAIGGLLLGLLAFALPQIHATGYPVMEAALHAQLPLKLVITLLFAKILATNLTLGSGGSGGVFAPSLFIGAMTGSAYGKIVHSLLPNITAGASSYAVVGMGAVFAGGTHAPLTAIIILFEMTQDYRIILPLMFSCIISTVVASKLQKKNIYTTKLLNRGVDIDAVEKETILKNIKVDEVMDKNPILMAKDDTIEEAKELFDKTLYFWLPVVDEKSDELIGMLNHHRVFKYWETSQDATANVENIVFPAPGVVYENDNLLNALQLMNEVNIHHIPVMKGKDSSKLVGVLNYSDISKAYEWKTSIEQSEAEFDLAQKLEVEIAELIEFSVSTLRDQAKEDNIDLEINLEDDLPPVKADANKISWVLTHLLVNAIRYTNPGGKVTVSSHLHDNWVTVSVKDTGEGIPEEYQDEIFKRYVSLAEDSSAKSGVGLSVSKDIIEEHDGHIWVDSNVGEGSTFTFCLKASKEESE